MRLGVAMHHFDFRLIANCNFLIDKQWCMIIPQSEYYNTVCQWLCHLCAYSTTVSVLFLYPFSVNIFSPQVGLLCSLLPKMETWILSGYWSRVELMWSWRTRYIYYYVTSIKLLWITFSSYCHKIVTVLNLWTGSMLLGWVYWSGT